MLRLLGESCAQILATFVCLVAIVVVGDRVMAQDGHSRWHHFYKNWKMPGTDISCCNARVIGLNGQTIFGDCEPTRAEIRNGDWYAWLRQEGRWIKIPDQHIVRERNPSGEEGHLCYNEWTKQILCFVPPDTGG